MKPHLIAESPLSLDTLSGVVTEGNGTASGRNNRYPGGSISHQLPFFAERGVSVDEYYQGTINLSPCPNPEWMSIFLARPSIRLEGIEWYKGRNPENFSLEPAFIYFNRKPQQAHIYQPDYKSKGSVDDLSTVQFVAPRIEGLSRGDQINFVCQKNRLVVAYHICKDSFDELTNGETNQFLLSYLTTSISNADIGSEFNRAVEKLREPNPNHLIEELVKVKKYGAFAFTSPSKEILGHVAYQMHDNGLNVFSVKKEEDSSMHSFGSVMCNHVIQLCRLKKISRFKFGNGNNSWMQSFCDGIYMLQEKLGLRAESPNEFSFR